MSVFSTTVISIKNSEKGSVEISFPSEKSQELTCHWLLEQTVLKLKQAFPDQENFDNIVALCTLNRDYAVDHLLTFPYRNLSVLRTGTVLVPFYRPAVKSQLLKEECSPKKLSLDDFAVEVKLGAGAF